MSLLLWPALTWLLVVAAMYAWRLRVLLSLPHCDRPTLPVAVAARAFLFETLSSAVALLSFYVDWVAPADQRSPATDSRGTVILVHDFGLNAGAFWLLRGRLRRRGWHSVALRHGALRSDARPLAAELRKLVEEVAAASPAQIVLLGHGLGGLVARLYGRDFGPGRVRRIVTLGAPHRGSRLSPLHGPLRKLLAPRGRLINYLEAADPVPQQFDVIALLSTFDAFVLPPANGEYPGVFNIQVNDVGHYALLLSKRVFGLLEESLAVPVE
jgi:pimeloyl-ACP methyl ester carboxylesterase